MIIAGRCSRVELVRRVAIPPRVDVIVYVVSRLGMNDGRTNVHHVDRIFPNKALLPLSYASTCQVETLRAIDRDREPRVLCIPWLGTVVAAVSPTQVQEEVDHLQEKLEEAMI